MNMRSRSKSEKVRRKKEKLRVKREKVIGEKVKTRIGELTNGFGVSVASPFC